MDEQVESPNSVLVVILAQAVKTKKTFDGTPRLRHELLQRQRLVSLFYSHTRFPLKRRRLRQLAAFSRQEVKLSFAAVPVDLKNGLQVVGSDRFVGRRRPCSG